MRVRTLSWSVSSLRQRRYSGIGGKVGENMNKLDVISNAVHQWAKRFKLNQRDEILLVEAYRRYHSFARCGGNISSAWLGLGVPSIYGKSSFFRSAGSITPHVLNWWLLTEKGINALVDLNASLPWDFEYNGILFTYPRMSFIGPG